MTYGARNIISEERYNAGSTLTHIKLSLWSIIKAVGIISILYTVEQITTNQWYSNLSIIPKWIITVQDFIPKPTYPTDRGSIVSLVSVIASVSGVILALFYPILATIASSAYSKVHSSIRYLLLHEKESQAYLRRLTYLTACAVTTLLFLSLNLLPGNLILAFLSLYALATLFGILRIGFGVYNFFDPSTLSKIVFDKLKTSIESVTAKGEYWKDKNFQNHNHKLAFEQVENLSILTSLCVKNNEVNETSFKSIIQTSFFALLFYSKQKTRIPIDSLWFPKSNNHRSYFESDMTYRGLLQNTLSFIQPDIKQNHFWFEEQIIRDISNGLEIVSKLNYPNVIIESIFMARSLLSSLGKLADVRTGETIIGKLHHTVLQTTENNEIDTKSNDYEDWKNELACIESFCYAILVFQLDLIDSIIELDSEKVIAEYNKINWDKKETIYSTRFIPDLYDSLNNYFLFVQNEIAVEKNQVTPDWYFMQSLISEYLSVISEKLHSAINLFQKYLISLATHFDTLGNALLTTYTSQIGLEALHKIQYRIDQLKTTFTDLDKIEVCKGEFRWTKPDFDTIESILNKNSESCYTMIAKNIEGLTSLNWNSKYPDTFGHSYALLSNRINDFFRTNKVEEFQNNFPAFFKASINAFEFLNRTFNYFEKPQNISYQALLDILEISGYGYIYSAIYEIPDYWTCVKKTWDEGFMPSKENINLFVTYYEYYKRSLFGTGVNFHEKNQRENVLVEVIKAKELKSRDVDDVTVKPFISDNHYPSIYSVAELFIEVYLFTFIEAKDATNLMRREFFKHWCWDIENPNHRNYDDL